MLHSSGYHRPRLDWLDELADTVADDGGGGEVVLYFMYLNGWKS